jgi:Na+-transporting NADH:ubiquinone oxidoreductase subunit C
MDNESPLKALIVVTATALVCSVLVTVAAVSLQPIQRAYQDLERIRFIVQISGIEESVEAMSDLEVIGAFQDLDSRIVDLNRGAFDDTYNPNTFDTSELAADPQFSVPIPADQDNASLGRRSRLVTVYLDRDGGDLRRIILPVYGQGMWSTIYGYLAIGSDLNTIVDMTIFEQGETPGIGDVILRPAWQAQWRGKKLYDDVGTFRFRISRDAVDPASDQAAFHVDGLAGATVTVNGVMNLMRYWFGPHGFEPFLKNLSTTGSI